MTGSNLRPVALALLLLALPASAMLSRNVPVNADHHGSPPDAKAQPEAPVAGGEGAEFDVARGREVFENVCSVCHVQGFADAPRVGDKAAWASRIAQGKSVLLDHALSGYQRMPPMGTCWPCSREDIADAITYMVERSQ